MAIFGVVHVELYLIMVSSCDFIFIFFFFFFFYSHNTLHRLYKYKHNMYILTTGEIIN